MCQLLGTPNERIWPGFSQLPLVKKMSLPFNPYNELKKKFPKLSHTGHDLFNRLLTYDPEKRVTAHEAEQHDYFKRDPRPKAPILLPTVPIANATKTETLREALQQGGFEGSSRAGLKRPRSG